MKTLFTIPILLLGLVSFAHAKDEANATNTDSNKPTEYEVIQKQLSEITAKLDTLGDRKKRPINVGADVPYLSAILRGEETEVINNTVIQKRSVLKQLTDLRHGHTVAESCRGPGSVTNALPLNSYLQTMYEDAVGEGKISEIVASNTVQNLEDVGSIALINHLYTAAEYSDWQKERIMFGGAATYITDIESVAATINIRAYPVLHRPVGGRFDNLSDGVWRRLGATLGVGTIMLHNDAKTDGTPFVIHAGLIYDISEGFGVTVGASAFTQKEDGADSSDVETSLHVGINLNSEFWQKLFK